MTVWMVATLQIVIAAVFFPPPVSCVEFFYEVLQPPLFFVISQHMLSEVSAEIFNF